jgi:type IV pilus assembly protein PilC
MLFSSTQTGLVQWCRAMKHGLGAGLSLVRVFQLQAKKGPSQLRDLAGRLADRLEKGDALEDALELEGGRLPALFRQLVSVGERTGNLPDIFSELADYYEMQQTLARDFRAQITWPVLQFVGAVFVIAFLIFILGVIGSQSESGPIAPIGFGLVGRNGAIVFLLAVSAFLGGLYGAYLLVTRGLRRRAVFEAFLLRLPAIGACAESLALGRFCLALRMTMEAGMSAPEALRHALRATGNAAFTRAEDLVVARIKAGDEVNVALRFCPTFSDEFREIVAVAEVSGQIPEVMIRQAEHYREEARRRLKMLAQFAGYAVWAFVAILIIWAIFRIASVYIGAINQAAG